MNSFTPKLAAAVFAMAALYGGSVAYADDNGRNDLRQLKAQVEALQSVSSDLKLR